MPDKIPVIPYWTKNNRRNRILSSVLSEFSDHKNDHFEEQLDVGYIGELIKEELDDKDYGIWEYHKEGYNNREIAEKLGMNEKTVANRKVGPYEQDQKDYFKRFELSGK